MTKRLHGSVFSSYSFLVVSIWKTRSTWTPANNRKDDQCGTFCFCRWVFMVDTSRLMRILHSWSGGHCLVPVFEDPPTTWQSKALYYNYMMYVCIYHIYIYTHIRICCANQHVLRILAYCRTESHQEPWAWPLHVTCHQRCLVSLFWPSVSECLQRRFTFNRTWFFLGLGVCIKDDFDFGWSENT